MKNKSLIGKKCKSRRHYTEIPASKIGIAGEESIDRLQFYIENSNEYKDGFLWNGFDYEIGLDVFKGTYMSREVRTRLTEDQPYPFIQKWWEHINENYNSVETGFYEQNNTA